MTLNRVKSYDVKQSKIAKSKGVNVNKTPVVFGSYDASEIYNKAYNRNGRRIHCRFSSWTSSLEQSDEKQIYSAWRPWTIRSTKYFFLFAFDMQHR